MASEFLTSVLDIPRLIGYVREQRFEGLTLDTVLPNVEVMDIEFELTNVPASAIQVARYRAWETAPPFAKRPGYAVIAGQIPPLGLTQRLGERDQMTLQTVLANLRRNGPTNEPGVPFFPYTRLPGGGRPPVSQLEDLIYNDALQMVRGVQARIEIARGQLLSTGSVTLAENGMNLTANFGVPGGQIVSAATAWSNTASSTPVIDLRAWLATYRAANGGRNPAFFITSSQVLADLTLNAQIRSMAPIMGVVPGVVSEQTIASVFASQGFPPIVTYDTMLPDASGTMQPVLPVRSFIAVGQGIGSTFYGVTPEAMRLAGEGVISMEDAPGVVAYVEQETRPAATFTTGAAIALPVLRDPFAILIATV